MSYLLTVEQAEAIRSVWYCTDLSIHFEVAGNVFCLRRESQDDGTGTLYAGSPGGQVYYEVHDVAIIRENNRRPKLNLAIVPSFCIEFDLEDGE